MSNVVLVFIALGGIAAIAGVSYWVGRRLQKGAQTKAVEEARQRMDKVQSGTVPSTAARLRRGDF